MYPLPNAALYNNNGAASPPRLSGDMTMSESLYSGPKIDGYYWYGENGNWQVVEYRSKYVYFCGDPMGYPVNSLKGEFHGPIQRPA